jgi:heme oxygenase
LNGAFDDTNYNILLNKLYAYYSELEKRYSVFFREYPGLDLEKRLRAKVLKSDLQNRKAEWPINKKVVVPVIDSIRKATGALYVIEGSSLGARFICQSLAQAGINETNGAAYFSGYGEETGKMWKIFVQFMNEVAITEADEQEVMDTAEKVFSSLYNWLND